MEEEIVIIVTRKQKARELPEGVNAAIQEDQTLTKTFTGPDRYKKAKKFLTALQD